MRDLRATCPDCEAPPQAECGVLPGFAGTHAPRRARSAAFVGSAVLDREQKRWLLECDAHVRVRLKRVFDRVFKGAFHEIALADTPENAHELRWFIGRYPMSVEPAAYLTKRAREYEARQKTVAQVLAPDYVPAACEMALPPRPYQALAADLCEKNGTLLLADELGLGKTISALALLAKKGALPAVVVTMTHLPSQWRREISRFLPNLLVHVLRKGQPYEVEKTRECKGRYPDIIITNYHKLVGWADVLAPVTKSAVFDEAQELRRSTSMKYLAAQKMTDSATYSMGLTATPIYNYGGEIFNVMHALRRDCLGTPSEFGREWCGGDVRKTTEQVSVREPEALGTYLRESGLMLRRTRKEVGREVPPLQRIRHVVDADEKELDKVQANAAELARLILTKVGTDGLTGFDRMRASEELSWMLRQATGIAKAPAVAAFIRMLVELGEKVVGFLWHREVYDILTQQLRDLDPVVYSGEESPKQKDANAARFIKGNARVMLMSLRSGAGLDGLQHVCRTMVFAELDWSPGVHEQCEGRVARDGQEHGVNAYYLEAEEGSDPIVADTLTAKLMESSSIRDPFAAVLEKQVVDPERVAKLARAYLDQIGA